MIAELLDAARAFALEAGELTLGDFGKPVEYVRKADGTPVSRTDREAEELLRARIRERYPDHSVLGEEFGETQPGSTVRWIVDPIDGTKAFIRGVPLYAVLVGVELEGRPVVGVAHLPALGDTVSAGAGLGCDWNGSPAKVSSVDRLSESLILTTDAPAIRSSEIAAGWERLERQARLSRGWGDAYGHILVATGRAELMVDPVLFPWDAAPLLTILTEAGGRFTTVGGEPTIHGDSGVSSNGHLHETVLAHLNGR